ncbi:hypothetical protein LCGC14_2140390, partial [marine sediment metagenome]
MFVECPSKMRQTAAREAPCVEQDLGFGLKYELYPTPYDLNGGYADDRATVVQAYSTWFTHDPGADIFKQRWIAGAAGNNIVAEGPSPPYRVGFDGHLRRTSIMENWTATKGDLHLPFLTGIPQHTTAGVGVEFPSPAVTINDWPGDGIDMHGQPFPMVWPENIMNGAGYLHLDGFGGYEESLHQPFPIRTEGQFYINLK